MIPTKNRVFIKETGFPPSDLDNSGLETSWEYSEDLRRHQLYRVGLVTHIGIDCLEVKEGDSVLFHIGNAQIMDTGSEQMWMIPEDYIEGVYGK